MPSFDESARKTTRYKTIHGDMPNASFGAIAA
jgi:hypothetical protein